MRGYYLGRAFARPPQARARRPALRGCPGGGLSRCALHVLAGCRDLLRPDPAPGEELAALIGPRLRTATAFWLSPHCGQSSITTSCSSRRGTARIDVFARALRDNFGTPLEPLMVLPDLLVRPRPVRRRGGRARAAAQELWRHRPAEAWSCMPSRCPTTSTAATAGLGGRGLLRRPRPRGGSTTLRAACADGGCPGRRHRRDSRSDPTGAGFAVLLRNALAQQVAAAPRSASPRGGAAGRSRPCCRGPVARVLAALACAPGSPRPARWTAGVSTGCPADVATPSCSEGRAMREATCAARPPPHLLRHRPAGGAQRRGRANPGRDRQRARPPAATRCRSSATRRARTRRSIRWPSA